MAEVVDENADGQAPDTKVTRGLAIHPIKEPHLLNLKPGVHRFTIGEESIQFEASFLQLAPVRGMRSRHSGCLVSWTNP